MTAPYARRDDPPGFLSEAACRDIARRLAQDAAGGGISAVTVWSAWEGNVRWARNQISTSGETRRTYIQVHRDLKGAMHGNVFLNETTNDALIAAARRGERLARMSPQRAQADLITWFPLESMNTPQLYDAPTATLEAEQRATAAIALAKQAADAGVLSAGYIEVGAHSVAMIDSLGHVRYCPYTTASYSVTVRDPTGTGSGWAGVDWPEWGRIDASALSQRALEKCLTSRNPVAIEPGRYTTILEPQAVCDLVGQLLFGVYKFAMGKACSVGTCGNSKEMPFNVLTVAEGDGSGQSKLGERIVDERITISSDPMDPNLSFPPFFPSAEPFGQNVGADWFGQNVFHPAVWIKEGVLNALEYFRDSLFGDVDGKQRGRGLPNAGGFRMSGGTTPVTEMIATTKRGLLVTRLDRLESLNLKSLLVRGYTRDGLWLIENGKISHPVKNLMFIESILFALNNIEQLGVPQRAYHPITGWLTIPQPVSVPPLKIKEFSFTAMTNAI